MQDINLAVCGHAGHGKSTLLGKAVSEFGMVSKKQIEAAKAAAREGKDPSFVFAHLVFRSKKISPTSEAARGITYQTALIRFELGDRRVTAIDTPGQEDYTNNLFIGMFQADGALLLVSAKDGIMPVTEQILRILVGFEIPLLGVSITKMDVKDYSEEVYRSRVKEVKAKLRELGLYKDKIVFFPTSAYQSGRDILDPGEGVESFQHCKWFKGPSFKDFLSGLDFQNIRPEAPLRALVHPTDAYDHVPGIGKAVTAVVESGVLREKDKLVFEPVSTEAGKPIIRCRMPGSGITWRNAGIVNRGRSWQPAPYWHRIPAPRMRILIGLWRATCAAVALTAASGPPFMMRRGNCSLIPVRPRHPIIRAIWKAEWR